MKTKFKLEIKTKLTADCAGIETYFIKLHKYPLTTYNLFKNQV